MHGDDQHSRVIREFAAWRLTQEERARRAWREAHPLGCTCEVCEGHRERLGRDAWVGRDENVRNAGAYLAGLAEGGRLEAEFRQRGGYANPSALMDDAQRALRDERIRAYAARLSEVGQVEPDRLQAGPLGS